MTLHPRPELLALSEAVHGAVDHVELARLGVDPDSLLDFSANVNPFGPSPQVQAVLERVRVDRYPDRAAVTLRQVLAGRLGISPDRLIVGNGSNELLWLLALAYLRPGDEVLILGPTYAEYARAARLMGAETVFCQASSEEGFNLDNQTVVEAIQSARPRLVFVCNPNNPTGRLLAADTLRQWIGRFPRTLFVVDEAYIEFAPAAQTLVPQGAANLVVLRSLAKAHSLAGLRLGYAVGDAELIRMLCRVRPAWNVNAAALAAGVAAVQDQTHLNRSLCRLAEARQALAAGLEALGRAPLPSTTHYFLVPAGNASQMRTELLQQGILVRDCTSFGLPQFIRVSTQRPEQNRALLGALGRLAGEQK